jgi:hypothetical protein
MKPGKVSGIPKYRRQHLERFTANEGTSDEGQA